MEIRQQQQLIAHVGIDKAYTAGKTRRRVGGYPRHLPRRKRGVVQLEQRIERCGAKGV